MAGVKQLKAWFIAATTDISRLRNFDKPNQQTFENLIASTTFSTESNDRAKISTGATLGSEQGLVVLTSDIQAKANQTQLTDRSLVVQPSQLPTNSTINQTVGDFTSDSPLNITIDGTISTRNNFIISLKSTFITFLNKYFPSFTNSTGLFMRSNGTNIIFDTIVSNDLPVIPITKGGTGQITASLAINTLMPTQTGNSGDILTTNGTTISWSNPSTTIGVLPITNGGTGQTTANTALNALLPSQTTNTGKVLQTDGTNSSWINTSSIVGGTLFDRQAVGQNLGTIGGSSSPQQLTSLVTSTGPNRNYVITITLSFNTITTQPENFIGIYYGTTGISTATLLNEWHFVPSTNNGASNIVGGTYLLNNVAPGITIYFGIRTEGSINGTGGQLATLVIDGVPV